MNKTIGVLLLDAHPFILEAYEQAIKQVPFKNSRFNIIKKLNSDEIKFLLDQKKNLINLVLIDLDLPPSKDNRYLSGEDVAFDLKEKFLDTKVIAFSSQMSNHRIYNIFKNINPDGFLIKSDFTQKELLKAIKEVLEENPYYSKTVLKSMRKHMASQILLDHLDREILHHLSNGLKMKELPGEVNLSLAGIERRKRNLKDLFNVDKQGDRFLIEAAREQGFV